MSYTTAKLLLTIVHRMIVMVVTNASVTSSQIDEWAKRLSFSSEERTP